MALRQVSCTVQLAIIRADGLPMLPMDVPGRHVFAVGPVEQLLLGAGRGVWGAKEQILR
jgi:hypothetical protein